MEDQSFNRNPDGINQHKLRSDTEVQKTIDKHPSWTKADFIGRGKLNPDEKNALLTRTEVDRKNLVFGHVGKRRRPLKDIYKLSTKENILRFENKEINEDTFRKNALSKSYRDKVSISQRKKNEKLRYKNLTEEQLEEKRERNKNYISNLSGKKLEKLKASESNRQKKRWANMSEAQKEIKREGDRIYQKRKAEMKRKERLKNAKN
ncbi:hypothetical protein N8963_04510 [Candidatus Pelagibacter sp.]|jgi:hypothetical protein|uniref:Uncharacterized protein n=1 Tax=Candidatus Pelagibacter giovannonii TaxID=2563896 RepID=A0A6H1Q267_9PROT|nr:hypothetical protein [Candidatus Pelagibacter giovannonii]MDA7806525.1 hypothetical protein [Candidatus Pelagibacter sp.]QIZ20918.1 hypothetical protein E5R92_03860 [Candidatus Pelagibacter giovannonii]|tara:strand:+ start:2166 stop:2783 length:618 start_codon:yes stop_codon:yes gene_type:complete